MPICLVLLRLHDLLQCVSTAFYLCTFQRGTQTANKAVINISIRVPLIACVRVSLVYIPESRTVGISSVGI